jgi:hypothetical protein
MAAIIVIAVVIFVAIDVYALVWLMRGRRKSGVHGSLDIPGTLQLDLRPGKVRVTYEEAKSSAVVVNDNEFGVPTGLELAITSPAGEPVELRGPGIAGMGESTSTGMGRSSQATVGVFNATETGTYTFTASGQSPDGAEARLLIGE